MAVKKAVKSMKKSSKKPASAKKKSAPAKSAKKVAKKPAKLKLIKTAKPAMAVGKGPVSKGFTKSELLTTIAAMADLSKKEVTNVLDSLVAVIERHIKKGAIGNFIFPGVLKLAVIRKPATKERKGINPFTGEPTVFKAKPARNVVKIKALKKIKDMV